MLKQFLSHFRHAADDDRQNTITAPPPPDHENSSQTMTAVHDVLIPSSPHELGRVDASQIASYFCDLLFGEAIPEQTAYSVAERQLLDQIGRLSPTDIVRSAALPRLPAIIPQILANLRDPEVSHDSIVGLVRQDPTVAGDVLKLANSAYFRRSSGPVDSIERAVFAIGQEGLRTIVSTSLMKPILRVKPTPENDFGQHLWQHALSCAVACREIASDGPHEVFTAYLLGLTHDVGKLAFWHSCAHASKAASHDGPLRLAVCKPLLLQQAAQLSVAIATDWQFPEVLLEALNAQIDPGHADDTTSLGHLLFLGNLCSEVHMLQAAGVYDSTEGSQLLQLAGVAPERWAMIAAAMQAV